MSDLSVNPSAREWLSHIVRVWPALAVVALVVFNLTGSGSKAMANGVYLLCLMPALVAWRTTWAAFLEEKVFFGVLLAFCAYAVSVTYVLHGAPGREIKYLLLVVLFAGFLRMGFRQEQDVHRLMHLLLVAGVLLLGYGLWDNHAHTGKRYMFTDVNANRSSAFFCFVFAWLMWVGFQAKGRQAVWLAGSGVLLFLGIFYLQQTRSIILCAFLFMAGVLWVNRAHFSRLHYALLLAGGVFLLGMIFGNDAMYQRLVSRGESYRFQIWHDAWQYMLRNDCYLAGCGRESGYRFLGRFENSHGLLMSVLFSYGLVGLGLFAGFLLYCLARLRGFYKAWLLGFLGFCIFTHTWVVDAPSLTWMYFWLPLLLGLQQRAREADHARA